MTGNRFVYTAIIDQFDVVEGKMQFIPSVVHEGQRGHSPLRGRGVGSSPWYWGESYEECQGMCDKYNLERLHIDPQEAAIIVMGSMRSQGEDYDACR